MMKLSRCLILILMAGLLFSACPGPDPGTDPEPDPQELAELDDVTTPEGFDASLVSRQAVDVPHADKIPDGYTVLGQAWDVRYDGQESTDFGGELVELVFTVDFSGVEDEGLITDFQGFYYDEVSQAWITVDGTMPGSGDGEVILYTSHLTIFIITAIEPSTDNVVEAPAAVAGEIFTGEAGTIISPPVPIIIDENFEYYRDRDYYIRPWHDPAAPGYSAENARVMNELGLNGGIGLATYNGGELAGYPLDDHKYYTGDNYMAFTAAQDLEVFVLYDVRGGADQFDFSEDADWLQSGFQVKRDGSSVPYYIQTTGAVGSYTVYSRIYSAGEAVLLHGNRRGVADVGINTNFWVMVKPADCPAEDNGFDSFIPADSRPDAVTNLTARPDSGDILLEWLLPAEMPQPDSWILVRRSTEAFPRTPYEGTEPAGTAVGETAFRDTSAPAGETLYYAVFVLDADDLPSPPAYCGIVNDGSGTVLPVVSTTFPVNGAVDVNPGNAVAITFNKEMDETTLTAANIYLKKGADTVSADVTYNAATRTVLIDPDGSLDQLASYYIIVTTDVRHTDGYALGSTFTSVFTTSDSEAEGQLDITIILGLTDPEPVNLGGFVTEITEAGSMELTASLDSPTGTEVTKWFINGEETGEGAALTVSGLREGHYRLDVIVYRDNVPMGGTTGLFEVTE